MIWSVFNKKKKPHILINELSSENPNIKNVAYHELLNTKDSEADELMLISLGSKETEQEKKLALISILGHRGCEEAISVLQILLHSGNQEINNAVLEALFEIGTPESIDTLVRQLPNSGDETKQRIHNLLSRLPENDALGSLLRCVPQNKNSELYFDIVYIMEELDFFEILKNDFEQPNQLVKRYYFEELIKFDRPEFIHLYFDYYKYAKEDHKEIILGILKSTDTKELISHFSKYCLNNNIDDISDLIDRFVITKYSELKQEILDFVVSLKNTQYRSKVLPSLLKGIDSRCFAPLFKILQEDTKELRELVTNTLVSLINKTIEKIDNTKEPNKEVLKTFIATWQDKLNDAMLNRNSINEDYYKSIRKLFFTICAKNHDLLHPYIMDLVNKDFYETYYLLNDWSFEDKFEIYSWMIKTDPSIGSIILSSLTARADDVLWRLAVKLSASFEEEEDSEVFQRNLVNRHSNISFEKFLKDNDPGIRASAVEICSKGKLPGYMDILKSYLKDPSPIVRKSAIKCLFSDKSADSKKLIREALYDPDESIILYTLKELKARNENIDFSLFLFRYINSKSPELREFAQQEVSTLTKERYKTNFNNMTPEMRKLTAQAISKMDNNFTIEIINDLSSFDIQTRLQAAMLLEHLQLDSKGQDALITAMKDPSQKVRAAVVKTLGIIGSPQIIKKLIECLNDSDTRVRANTIEAISSLGDANIVRILLPFLEDSNNRIRANAIVGICKFGRYNVASILQSMLADAEINMRASALWAIGEIGELYYIQLAYPFIQDKEELIRFNAVKAISRINPQILIPYMPLLRKDNSSKIRTLVKELSHRV